MTADAVGIRLQCAWHSQQELILFLTTPDLTEITSRACVELLISV